MIRMLFAITVAACIAGCAAAPAAQPTHYWASPTAKDNQYRADNFSCQRIAFDEPSAAKAFDPNDASFQQYRNCMASRGYELHPH